MKFSELIKTREIKVPGTDLIIKIKTELSWIEELEYYQTKNATEAGKLLMSRIIVEWNLEDEEGKSLPINEDIISRLPMRIILPISEETTKIIGEIQEKKKS